MEERDVKGRFIKGHGFSEETLQKIKSSLKGRRGWNKGMKMPISYRNKLSKIKKQMAKEGKLVGLFTSENGKGREDTQFKTGHFPIKSCLNGRKTGNEIFLEKLMKDNNLPYDFVGDGKVWIENYCPDFIDTNGQKKIIELNGGDIRRDILKSETYKRYGYSTLIVRLHELRSNPKAILSKLQEFDAI